MNDAAKRPPHLDPVSFRSAVLSDVAAIVELWQLAGVATDTSGSESEQDRIEIHTRLQRDEDLFVVAEDDEKLVATVMGCYDGHRGWIKRFAVHPDRRRSGLGRLLTAELERRFVEAGITELRLSAWRSNELALDFWNAMGFDEIDIAYFTKSLR